MRATLVAAMGVPALALTLATARPASAVEYEIPIRVESEEDLYDLYATQQISEETFDTLLELFRRGVDLGDATREELYSLPNLTLAQVDRILEYRREAGRIADPAELVVQGILTAEELSAIAPFFAVEPTGRVASPPTTGWLRDWTLVTAEDSRFPPMAMQARISTLGDLTLGGAFVLTRNRLGPVRYDPNRDGLVAEDRSARLELPKLFALWNGGDWAVLVGTYKAGFGERLTFDTTDRYTPSGFYLDDTLYRSTSLVRACVESMGELPSSPCAGDAGDVYVSPDFRWREGLRGLAARLERVPVAEGWLEATGFASYQTRSVYQYEIYDRGRCPDPTADDEACAAPRVFRKREDPLAPTTQFSYMTLPDMYNELTVGANATIYRSRRARFGLTGYRSSVDWLTEGIDLDFQEWSRYPRGGPFGAVGAHVGVGHDWYDLAVEIARSFDGTPAGGGFGAVARNTATFDRSEVELALRAYGTDFANPYAGSISAPDEYEGLRARDEVGGRLRLSTLVRRRLSLRALADVWVQPSDDRPQALAYARADVRLTDRMDAGLWLQAQDKDLRTGGGSGVCFEASVETDAEGEPVPCTGSKLQATGRLRIAPQRRLTLSGQYQHAWLDDPRYPGEKRQDLSAWVLAAYRPLEPLTVRARARYLFQDLSDPAYLERSLWTYVDVAYRQPRGYLLRLRYDLYAWLDDRESTATRVPNPEHWLLLEVEARF